jgi:hypothetical protein
MNVLTETWIRSETSIAKTFLEQAERIHCGLFKTDLHAKLVSSVKAVYPSAISVEFTTDNQSDDNGGSSEYLDQMGVFGAKGDHIGTVTSEEACDDDDNLVEEAEGAAPDTKELADDLVRL